MVMIMLQYKNILVVIDTANTEQPALERALHLARLEGQIKLKLLLVFFDLSYEMTSMFSPEERESMRTAMIDERKKWLADLVSQYQGNGLKLELKVIWHNRPFESIIKETIDGQHDLVIKSTHKHPKLQSIIFTPTDWHLLRKCPTPLLLVKDHTWRKNGKILAAVNSLTENEHHQHLNEKIISEGLGLATILNASLHLVNAYPGTPINLALELPEFDITDYSETLRANHQEQLSILAKKFNIDDNHCHVVEGEAEYAIAELAESIDIELLILGTIGRSGLSAAIIGNTAENIIDQLNCDLLAIKPVGFVCPLQK